MELRWIQKENKTFYLILTNEYIEKKYNFLYISFIAFKYISIKWLLNKTFNQIKIAGRIALRDDRFCFH